MVVVKHALSKKAISALEDLIQELTPALIVQILENHPIMIKTLVLSNVEME